MNEQIKSHVERIEALVSNKGLPGHNEAWLDIRKHIEELESIVARGNDLELITDAISTALKNTSLQPVAVAAARAAIKRITKGE